MGQKILIPVIVCITVAYMCVVLVGLNQSYDNRWDAVVNTPSAFHPVHNFNMRPAE